MNIIKVALDVPVTTLFDYRLVDATIEDVGCRVVVPFGKKRAIGVIVEVLNTSSVAPGRLKPALQILRDSPRLENADLELLQFASDYYHYPLGAAIMGTLPARLRRPRLSARTRQVNGRFMLTEAGTAIDPSTLPARAHLKRRLLALLHERAVDAADARALSARAPPVLKELMQEGLVRLDTSTSPLLTVPRPLQPAPPLTAEQEQALTAVIADLQRFRVHLLLGVTGSGKTEVYLHAMAAVLAAGCQALLLVPEIALTPQLESLVRSRFPDVPLVTLHSGLNDSERLAHWLEAQSGRAGVVLGTRLAVFAPMPQLGIIIIDEEHDGSFKQTDGFRYSARDIAVVRARQYGVPIILGSATPSLESYFNAANGRYQLSVLGQRIGAPLPHIECVDTRGERLEDGLSGRLLQTLDEYLARGEQSLVFINRRGYAPVLMCHSCGWISGCHRCSAQLVLHLKQRQLRCHHCGHIAAIPPACPDCGNPQLAPLGQGTQRVEDALAQRYAESSVLRIDRDSMRPRHAWPAMRRRIYAGDVKILVGTQILAKGHDFPHLNLVGVLNADSMLYSADFRASERLLALLMQVAGRAGRGTTQGRVLIQTEFPNHPLYQALKLQDYRAFADRLLEERRQAGFPPFLYQALLRAEAPRLAAALDFLRAAAVSARSVSAPVTLYDPVPAAMPRRAGRERAQLLVQCESRARLQQFVGGWHRKLSENRSASARWAIDVDPLEF
ncbi:MAG: primosomal protein N' [Betaproteobacteria bacterium]|nr:primosomal protein N' [Betaproteobacteria bacterium]MDH3436103.1 primosomal protein N' [Betaproteobacteria bacterium]